ncbi:hypothetical protein TVAG_490880 [Trichomonas vaginalis G3]|uniref:Uncharacterized protein n=1 Tax=Trichomonas vaginalis (strain ATCC PRA-98 / G3) TaxID=412133 RepID=A2E031_TRIV3|nr:hypothetical protein TVAGG3_0218800 [Trichomonas vaginalis G3]EAY13950.1 hypothetical protein TVAG_490880 [Trichomonas vaginalis G3]KAI5551761.1 hypothetical protein TVAGG3_0218800 [Trichomonas vaginalis G3]|eukprot:XP_001326173.1 hypothetical protein [Trichomonas vaginalis G3]
MTTKFKQISKEIEDVNADLDIETLKLYIKEFEIWLNQFKGKNGKRTFFSQKPLIMKFLQVLSIQFKKQKNEFKTIFTYLPSIIKTLVLPGNDYEIRKETLVVAIPLVDYSNSTLSILYNFWIEFLLEPLFAFNNKELEDGSLKIGDTRDVTANDIISFNEILISHLDEVKDSDFIYWYKLLAANSITAVLENTWGISPEIQLKFAQIYAKNLVQKVNSGFYTQFIETASKTNKHEPRAFTNSFLAIIDKLVDPKNSNQMIENENIIILFKKLFNIITTLPESKDPIDSNLFTSVFIEKEYMFSYFGHTSERELSTFIDYVFEIDKKNSINILSKLLTHTFEYLTILSNRYGCQWKIEVFKYKTEIFNMSNQIQLTKVMAYEIFKHTDEEQTISLIKDLFNIEDESNLAISFLLFLYFEQKIDYNTTLRLTKQLPKSTSAQNIFRAYVSVVSIVSYGIFNNIPKLATISGAINESLKNINDTLLDTIRDSIRFSFISYCKIETKFDKEFFEKFLEEFRNLVENSVKGVYENSFYLVWHYFYLSDETRAITQYNDTTLYNWVLYLKKGLIYETDRILKHEYMKCAIELFYSCTVYSFNLMAETATYIRTYDKPFPQELLLQLTLVSIDMFGVFISNQKCEKINRSAIDPTFYVSPMLKILEELIKYYENKEMATLIAFSAFVLVYTRIPIGISSDFPSIDLFKCSPETVSIVLAMLTENIPHFHPKAIQYINALVRKARDLYFSLMANSRLDVKMLSVLTKFAATITIYGLPQCKKICTDILSTPPGKDNIRTIKEDVLMEIGYQFGEFISETEKSPGNYEIKVRSFSETANFQLNVNSSLKSITKNIFLNGNNFQPIQKGGMILYLANEQCSLKMAAENKMESTSKSFAMFAKSLGKFRKSDNSITWRFFMNSFSMNFLPTMDDNDRKLLSMKEEFAVVWDARNNENLLISDLPHLKAFIILKPVLANYILVKVQCDSKFKIVVGPLQDKTLFSKEYLPSFVRWTVQYYYMNYGN